MKNAPAVHQSSFVSSASIKTPHANCPTRRWVIPNTARGAKVESAKDLRFAAHRQFKAIHFISTVDVFSQKNRNLPRVVQGSNTIDQGYRSHSDGYAAGKWVGEAMFLEATKRGVSRNIVFLGPVWADTQQGRYDYPEHEYRVLKSCCQTGIAVKGYRYAVPATPSTTSPAPSFTWSTNSPKTLRSSTFQPSPSCSKALSKPCNRLTAAPLQLLSHYDWLMQVKCLSESGDELSIAPPVKSTFHRNLAAFEAREQLARRSVLILNCARTNRELELAGIHAPIWGDQLVGLCLPTLYRRAASLKRLRSLATWLSTHEHAATR